MIIAVSVEGASIASDAMRVLSKIITCFGRSTDIVCFRKTAKRAGDAHIATFVSFAPIVRIAKGVRSVLIAYFVRYV